MAAADTLWRRLFSGDSDEVAGERARFIEGAAQQGIEQTIAARIFSVMESAAPLTFNKSHAVAYAVLTFQTAYLKALFPQEFGEVFLVGAKNLWPA
jgi:DNA polymerase-3 subunit alpha